MTLPILCALIFSIATIVAAIPPQSELNALLHLKQSITNGQQFFSNWTSQNRQLLCSDWYGVMCNYDRSHVIQVRLEGLGLKGKLPVELGNLTHLQLFSIFQNELFGSVPPSIIHWRELRILSLGLNKLEGYFPDLNATGLQFIDLRGNNFVGELPASLGKAPSLKVLSLGLNGMEGILPKWIWSLSKLQIIDLSGNSFSGKLPLNPLLQLHSFQVVQNGSDIINQAIVLKIKGIAIKYSVVKPTVVFFDVSGNHLSGHIPLTIGSMVTLRYLNLGQNNFDGNIPLELANITYLEQLDVSYNNLSGGIPSELTSLTSLVLLNVSYNHLEGPIPSKNQFPTFDYFSFEGNPELCGLPLNSSCPQSGPGQRPSERGRIQRKWWEVTYALGCVTGVYGIVWMIMLWHKAKHYMLAFDFEDSVISN